MVFKPSIVPINKYNMDHLYTCIDEIWKWICSNMLKSNEDKTEFIILGTWQQLCKAIDLCVNFADKTF